MSCNTSEGCIEVLRDGNGHRFSAQLLAQQHQKYCMQHNESAFCLYTPLEHVAGVSVCPPESRACVCPPSAVADGRDPDFDFSLSKIDDPPGFLFQRTAHVGRDCSCPALVCPLSPSRPPRHILTPLSLCVPTSISLSLFSLPPPLVLLY